MLPHLELRDFVEFLLLGNVAVVHAEDFALFLGNPSTAKGIGSIGSTLLGNGDAGYLGSIVETRELGKSAPSAPDIEHLLAFLQGELLANDSHFVILELFEGFLLGSIRDGAAGINHTWAEEPSVVIVSTVVVGADLVHILLPSMREDIAGKCTKNELHERPGEGEMSPVVAVLQNIKDIAVHVSLTVDVHLGEVLHRNLGPVSVLALKGIHLEGDVGLDGSTRKLGFVRDARAEIGSPGPDDNQQWEKKEDSKENSGLEAAAKEPR